MSVFGTPVEGFAVYRPARRFPTPSRVTSAATPVMTHFPPGQNGIAYARFSVGGVSVTNELGTFTYKWRVFTALWCMRDLYMLILVHRTSVAIPRTALSRELSEFISECFHASRGRPHCLKCGYDLRGQTVPRCPECGAEFDAEKRFEVENINTKESPLCISGLVLQGRQKPNECPAFGKECTPEHPLGATMVSSEGACAAYYRYGRMRVEG